MAKEILKKSLEENDVLKGSNSFENQNSRDEAIVRTSAEVLQGADLGVESSERVSENAGEGREKKGDAITGAIVSRKKFDPAQIKAHLLKSIPAESVMRAQVEKEIKNEIKYLRKKAFKMLRTPHKVSFFELANIVRKIRSLRSLLVELVRASFDRLKTLWLRFVHGIM